MTVVALRDDAHELVQELRGPASSIEKLKAIVSSPITAALADAIPDKPRAGRPRDFHPFHWITYHALMNFVWPSSRQVEAELNDDDMWPIYRKAVRRRFPDRPELWVSQRKRIHRWHYTHGLQYLRKPEILERLKEVWREEVAKLAVELGLFSPEGEMPWTHPDADRFMQWDGTVLTPMYKSKSGRKKDKKTGKMKRVRYDRDAKLHTIGGGKKAFGVKHGIVSARTDRDRIFLDWEHVPDKGEGGEAGMGMRCFGRLAPLLPGAQGVNSDKAMRGTHIDQAMRELGWLIVTGVHDVKDKEGNPVDWHIEDVPAKRSDGTEGAISIYARAGAAGILERNEIGDRVFVPLELEQRRRRGRAGHYRFYNDFEPPAEYERKPLRVRMHGNAEDARRGLNRAEHLRAIPPSDPDFKRLNRRRPEAEARHRTLKDTMWPLRRAHSVGHVAQDADLLGFALGMNALVWRRNQRRGPPTAA